MVMYGPAWSCMVMFGHVSLYMVMYGHVWLFIALCGHLRSCMVMVMYSLVMYHHVWSYSCSCVAMHDVSLSKVLYGHIWLELTRTYIPIRRMSPKRLHSRTSHVLSVNRNCMGFFASGQKLPRGR